MLHPDFRLALALAQIEDLQRKATRRQTIRLARRRAEQPHAGDPSIAGQRSASDPPRQSRTPRPTAGHDERPSPDLRDLKTRLSLVCPAHAEVGGEGLEPPTPCL